MPDQPSVEIIDAGLLDYAAGLKLQEELHGAVLRAESDGFLVLCEHPSVLTLGKNCGEENIVSRPPGVPVMAIERGGDVTAHMPGQLVAYPILAMKRLNLTPKKYVCLLEETVIRTLQEFGIASQRDPVNAGVWIGLEKICAIGVRIKERVSMHGAALNVCNDLELFQSIVPCGVRGRGVTSISSQSHEKISVAAVKNIFLASFAKVFPFRLAPKGLKPGLQSGEELRMMPDQRTLTKREQAMDVIESRKLAAVPDPVERAPMHVDNTLLPCCARTIDVHAKFNPMMVCGDCKQIIKYFNDEKSFVNYCRFCESRHRKILATKYKSRFIVVQHSYDMYAK